MLRSLLVALVLLVTTPMPDVAYGQYYEPLRAAGREQRKNDPFVFCRYGLRKTLPAWKPLPTYSGPWMPMPTFCPYPSLSPCCFGWVCLRAWPQEDYQAWFLYQRVCPQAGFQGGKNWDGAGDGRNVDSNGTNVH